MKSFLSFLFESDFKETSWGYHHRWESPLGHVLSLDFYRPTNAPNDHYSVSFTTNQNPERHYGPEQGAEMMRYVTNKVQDFVREKKPARIHFHGDTEKKHHLYTFLAKKIARRGGGVVSSERNPTDYNADRHVITFPGKLKE